MNWQSFFSAFHSSALRDLPIAYMLVIFVQGGYFFWILRRWTGRDSGE